MNKIEIEKESNVNLRLVTFIIIVIVISVTLLYFVRIYTNKQARVLSEMKMEADILQTVIEDHLNYAKYFINIISKNIEPHYHDLNYINTILCYHSQNFNLLYGWRKISWIDKNFEERVTSSYGISQKPRKFAFMQDIIDKPGLNNLSIKEKIVFYTKKTTRGDSFKLIENLTDLESGAYIGSVILSYDLATIIRGLNKRRQSPTTNFVIIDQNLEIVARSSKMIDKIIDGKKELSPQLKSILEKIDFTKTETPDYSYLEMMDGVNFYIKPIKHRLPFIIIVNIDNNIIRRNILVSVAKKFIEVSVFAVICLIMVIWVYKRETALRAKAEQATKEANKANKAKTDFLAFTAHEIRSPLGFVLTGSEIMTKQLMGELPQVYAEYAEGIHQNAQIILDFITDILDENQILEGKFKIINSPANLRGIIREAIRVNKARYKDRKLTIKAVYPKQDLPKLNCDKRRILQVLSNLISNGIRYSSDNTKLTVYVILNAENLEIQVVDQGIGMSKEDINIALSPYGVVHKSIYHSIGSYGLGLRIVKMLLEAHSAELKIESEENVGTSVKVIFLKEKLVYDELEKE